MKVIDLLNKIANDEEIPNYVQYYNMLEDKIDIMMVCKENIFYKLDNLEIQLKSRIDPVEEEKKIPEKLYGIVNPKEGTTRVPNNEQLMYKINEIIDYLKSKGDE